MSERQLRPKKFYNRQWQVKQMLDLKQNLENQKKLFFRNSELAGNEISSTVESTKFDPLPQLIEKFKNLVRSYIVNKRTVYCNQ